jgi:hypothetical protein
MDSIPAEYSARISALEAKVAALYAHLGLVEGSASASVADALPDDVVELAREGRREEAIRALALERGLTTADAMAQVNGYLRSIGH